MLAYSAGFQVTLSDTQRAAYKDQLGWDDERIDLEELKRTQEFHELHNRFSVLGDTYNPDWKYDASNLGYEPIFTPAQDVDSANDTISIGVNLLTTGTGVVYNTNGGAKIRYLDQGEWKELDEEKIYYIIKADPNNPGILRLSDSLENAGLGIYLDIDASAATGTDHTFSDVDALAIGSSWTEEQLRYSLGAGWLKETTDTETRIEASNLIGKNIVINASGSIGHFIDEQIILISNGDLESGGILIELSREDKAALAAAERADLISIKSDTNTISFGTLHDLESGAPVVFGPGGNMGVGGIQGLTDGVTYMQG
jgi:hypothetical protein